MPKLNLRDDGFEGVGFFHEPVIPEIQFRHDNFLLLL